MSRKQTDIRSKKKKMNPPIISIIVPVYNAEKFLVQCLDSLINQTYENIEIICVNDGSTDGSLNIIKNFQALDKRIHCIDKQNQGVSAARNDALQAANGQLVMCVDADDWIEPETVATVAAKLIETDSDVVMWPYVSEKQGRSDVKSIFPEDLIFQGSEVQNKLHRRFIGLFNEELAHPELADSLCTVWGKLYKTELLKDFKFIDLNEIGTYEDGFFNLEVFGRVQRAAYINRPMYHYRRTNDGSQTSIYREKLFSQWMHLFDLMQNYIEWNQLGIEYQIALKNRIALSIVGLGLNISSSEMSKWEKIDALSYILNNPKYREAYKQLKLKWFPIHWKLYYFCAKHRLSIGIYLLGEMIRLLIS